ncbi:MAG: glycosyltransferase [candidate division Zixibacteria bacterium]|nr:glycosyltransferase [candidate division Zixibacteria bacterium]
MIIRTSGAVQPGQDEDKMVDINKCKILHLANIRWWNACAYYAIQLADAQRSFGHEVLVAGDPDSPPLSKALSWGLAIDPYPRISTYFPYLYSNMKWLSRMVDNGYKLVVVHRGEAHVVAFLTKYYLEKDFTLIRVRGDVRPPRNDIYNRFLYDINYTDGVICTTETLKQSYLETFEIDKERITAIPAGVDSEYFGKLPDSKELRRKYMIPENATTVTLLGRLDPVKGHDILIRAAGGVKVNPEDVYYIIAGEECNVNIRNLKELISKHCPKSNFKFFGLVDDVRDILGITDIAVIPSQDSEMIARTALEFMAAGKPVIASNINALAETVDHGKGGYLVDKGNISRWADYITELIHNPEKRCNYGSYNRDLTVENFSLHRWASNTLDFYQQIIELKNGPSMDG